MQLVYGTYSFPVNGVRIASRTRTVMSKGMTPLGIEVTMAVSGFLQLTDVSFTGATAQADLTASENALRLALASHYLDLVFKDDNAVVTSTALLNASSLTGVRITDGPHFPGEQGNEYATQRAFNFEASAEYPYLLTFRYTDFSEDITYRGGSPIRDVKLAINGAHQIQTIYPTSPYFATQSGKAFGYLSYPAAPAPIWPTEIIKPGEFSLIAPERKGVGLTNYGISWRYEFASLGPLIGSPNVWTGN